MILEWPQTLVTATIRLQMWDHDHWWPLMTIDPNSSEFLFSASEFAFAMENKISPGKQTHCIPNIVFMELLLNSWQPWVGTSQSCPLRCWMLPAPLTGIWSSNGPGEKWTHDKCFQDAWSHSIAEFLARNSLNTFPSIARMTQDCLYIKKKTCQKVCECVRDEIDDG